ncbi:MAG: anaerobic ribonucleoside-triphosphate reductase activating protein [Candidatus Buchananbacteria bacterium RIFCSPHIGHO2_01_FULL_47_11b]|uniref:Anaerobic ribonucleoside-triphosphate reductase activating protein n=1 Tax=Candidatus Buchananbacteria bacterium RIFCSPHIGHO2_01_FULL_47_11b TaxID=1797537 RepID=A0A1G1Y7D0_9BACT|nr:MAG: anaerobic ribonucleoside-triphosphate reductase activating protein [Candidatus Buchananbacteria bacterium RIFCSPHIGHO2_01_FULL_47_11b]
MIIGGLQKLSLIDYPEKVSAVVFTQGCLFRCPFCHNPELIPIGVDGQMSQETVLRFLQERKKFLDGVCITGGEPTIHRDLPEFIKKIKQLGYSVKLDTAGVNPEMVEQLIADKLIDYVAMDLKNSWPRYQEIVRTANPNTIENCKKTFKLLQQSGIDHEFRTTVYPPVHTEQDFFEMVEQLKSGERYFIQNISYTKNLEPNIDRTKQLDVTGLVVKLKSSFPRVLIDQR